jgi:hypothetical protein
MPPLPFSSGVVVGVVDVEVVVGAVVVVVGSVVSVVVDSVVVGAVDVVVGAVVSALPGRVVTDSELEAVELPLSLPAITITATTRPTITATRQATTTPEENGSGGIPAP